ncbi:MAG: competence protein ComK [Bacillota bacterium]
MQYMERVEQGLLVKTQDHKTIRKMGMKQFLNRLLKMELATYEGRIKTLRETYALKNNVPIYVDETTCLYMSTNIRDQDTVCINYHSVLSIREKSESSCELIFKDLSIKTINVPYKKLMHRHLKAAQLLQLL